MKKYILVTLDSNYSDEFDGPSLWVTTQENYDKFLEKLKIKEINQDTEIYFGTNEYRIFDSLASLQEALSIKDISKEFYDGFCKYIGKEFGMISIVDILDHY